MGEQRQTVSFGGGGIMSPEDYMRHTLRLCLLKRKAQLPATHAAADYAQECDAKLEALMAAIGADDKDAVREILDWSKATHGQFTALKEAE